MRRLLTFLAVAVLPGTALAQQSAPVTDLRYDLTFTSATALAQSLTVTTRFQAAGTDPVLLSLPSWTPGAYEISNFARRVSRFAATQGGQPLTWDKTDPDTWRIRPAGKGEVTLTFDFQADQLDNAMAWSRPDFLMVNGTNVFLYPEGRSLDFPARVTVTTEPAWRVATGMTPDGAPRVRLKLAQILIVEEKRPGRALSVLEKIPPGSLPPEQEKTRRNLEHHARKAYANAELEVDGEDW